MNDVCELARQLLEVHHYECLCGAGVTKHQECRYCMARERLAVALHAVGCAPDWFVKEKEREKMAYAASVRAQSNLNGDDGAVQFREPPPNCS